MKQMYILSCKLNKVSSQIYCGEESSLKLTNKYYTSSTTDIIYLTAVGLNDPNLVMILG
jgi:hypothetical protein